MISATQTPKQLSTETLLELFLKENQSCVKNGATLASIPCGSMKEILELNFTRIDNIRLIGIDPDFDKIKYAQDLADKLYLNRHTNLLLIDTTEVNFRDEFDLISCSNLDFLSTSSETTVDFYFRLYKALKPGGKLTCLATSNTQEHLKSAGFTQIQLIHDSTQKNALIIAYK